MIMGQLISGPWGLGETPANLVSGTQFKCDPGVGPAAHSCYGIGSIHELFKSLQELLNLYATKARFAPLVVDGFIGTATVNAVIAVDAYLRSEGLAGGFPSEIMTTRNKAVVAAKAMYLVEILKYKPGITVATGSGTPGTPPGQPGVPGAPPMPQLEQPPSAPPLVPQTGGGTAPATGGGTAVVHQAPPAPAKTDNTVWWIVGACAFVAVATVTTVIIVKKRRPKSLAAAY